MAAASREWEREVCRLEEAEEPHAGTAMEAELAVSEPTTKDGEPQEPQPRRPPGCLRLQGGGRRTGGGPWPGLGCVWFAYDLAHALPHRASEPSQLRRHHRCPKWHPLLSIRVLRSCASLRWRRRADLVDKRGHTVAFLAGLLGLVWALSGPTSHLLYFYFFLFILFYKQEI